MDIQYLSHAEAAQFGAMLHSGSELAELFGAMILLLDVDTDYDTVMISFDHDNVLRVVVDDSPYVIVLDELNQTIELWRHTNDELVFDEAYDFDEDGVEMIVDVIASRILGEEYSAN